IRHYSFLCSSFIVHRYSRRPLMLPKTAEYALRAVVWLGRPVNQDDDDGNNDESGADKKIGLRAESADALAEITKVPRRYLHTVLQDLRRAGLVRSHPGPGGGYALARPPKKITILDVVNAVAPLERIHHCPLGIPSHQRLCPLHKEIDDVYKYAEQ